MLNPEKKPKKIVLAYSGGLDTSIILTWLRETYDAEVICFAADLGQEEELSGLEEKAKSTGASKIYIEDLKEEFARDFIFPAIQANATYEMRYLLGTALARPLIAKAMVDIAIKEGADSLSHGATGKGNDQVRFELGYQALAPELMIIAPWRIWDFKSRTDLINYAKKHNIPITSSAEKPYSMDRNLMHISFEGGILEDPYNEPKKDMFVLTVAPEDAPDKPEYIEVDFEKGNPVAINGEKLSPYNLMNKLNKIAGRNGVGRIDIVEDRLVGMKSRGVYETPAGTVLIQAHRDLESIILDKEVQFHKDNMVGEIAKLIYNGMWFSQSLQSFFTYVRSTQEYVTGTVRLKLYKGLSTVVGRKSKHSIYNTELVTFEEDDVYNQAHATGFIELFGLSQKEAARRNTK